MKKECQICKKVFTKTPKTGKNCNTCASRVRRERNPVWAAYDNIRSRAKRENIPFTITLEWFEKFAHETNYIQKKGKEKKSLTVDRKIAWEGYTEENIQILSLEENGRKGAVEKRLMYIDAKGLRYCKVNDLEFNEEDYPF